MLVKMVSEVSAPFVDSKFLYYNKAVDLNNVNKIKKLLDKGFDFLLYVDGEWIDAEVYFNNEEEFKSTSVVSEKVEVIEEVEEEDDLEDLKQQAKELGVSNYWVMKEDTLKEKIKEKLEE